MPRYFFNVHDGRNLPDEEGTVLPDPDAVRRYAIRLAGDLIHEEGERFWRGGGWRLVVSDPDGHEVLSLTFTAHDAMRG